MSWGTRNWAEMDDAVQVYTPAEPSRLMRSHVCTESGLFCLARRHAAVYSVEIHSGGGWGRFTLMDGRGKPIFSHPSAFTGSFPLHEACAFDGLYLLTESGENSSDAQITVNWREQDGDVV